jgi:hypothetical protein
MIIDEWKHAKRKQATLTSNSTPERTKTNRQTEHNKNAGSQAKEHPSCQ